MSALNMSLDHGHEIEYTAAQAEALEAFGQSIEHATHPAGPGSTLYVYDADDDLMTLWTVEPDGSWKQEQRAFYPADDWDVVASSAMFDAEEAAENGE